MKRHVILFNPYYDQWEPESGQAYEYHVISDRPGALYRLIEWKLGIGTARDYREDVLAGLKTTKTYSEARAMLDDFSEMDVTEGDGGGEVWSDENWRERNRELDAYPDNSPGAIASRLDPHNAYNAAGEKIGSLCHCEDYPCCGH